MGTLVVKELPASEHIFFQAFNCGTRKEKQIEITRLAVFLFQYRLLYIFREKMGPA